MPSAPARPAAGGAHVPYTQPSLVLTYVRTWRLWHGWEQKELARRAGLSRRTISQMERGYAVRISTAARVCKALGATLQEVRRTDKFAELAPTSPPPDAAA